METFFQFFERKTGRTENEARQIIKIVSGYLAKNYKKEFAVLIQYFLTYTFDQKKPPENDTSVEWRIKNQNA